MGTLLFRILLARVWHLNTRIWPKNSFSWNQNSTLFCKNLGESFDRGDIYSGGWGQKSHDPWYLSHLANTHSIGVIAHPKLAWTPCMSSVIASSCCISFVKQRKCYQFTRTSVKYVRWVIGYIIRVLQKMWK